MNQFGRSWFVTFCTRGENSCILIGTLATDSYRKFHWTQYRTSKSLPLWQDGSKSAIVSISTPFTDYEHTSVRRFCLLVLIRIRRSRYTGSFWTYTVQKCQLVPFSTDGFNYYISHLPVEQLDPYLKTQYSPLGHLDSILPPSGTSSLVQKLSCSDL